MRTEYSQKILDCLVAYRHNFEAEQIRTTPNLLEISKNSQIIVDPKQICGDEVSKIMKMDTEGCFGDIFDVYLEVISMYKILQTAQIDDKEQAELDKSFENSV